MTDGSLHPPASIQELLSLVDERLSGSNSPSSRPFLQQTSTLARLKKRPGMPSTTGTWPHSWIISRRGRSKGSPTPTFCRSCDPPVSVLRGGVRPECDTAPSERGGSCASGFYDDDNEAGPVFARQDHRPRRPDRPGPLLAVSAAFWRCCRRDQVVAGCRPSAERAGR